MMLFMFRLYLSWNITTTLNSMQDIIFFSYNTMYVPKSTVRIDIIRLYLLLKYYSDFTERAVVGS